MALPTEPQQPGSVTGRSGMFIALSSRNFRLLALGFLLANTGWWMLFTTQSWLVLNLTGSAASVGLTGALVYVPSVFFGVAGGVMADRYPKRRILLSYFVGWVLSTALLAGLALSGTVLVWQVQLIMAGIGIVMAFGFPAFHPLVAETVEPAHVRGAISLTFSCAQLAALIGPATAGLLITSIGPGDTLLAATACYAVPLVTLVRLRTGELRSPLPSGHERGRLNAGLRYAMRRPDVLWPTILIGLFGMFTTNLPVTLAVYARSVFESGPGGYGLLTTIVAVGALGGTLISAKQSHTRLRRLALFGGLLSVLYIVSAVVPDLPLFCILLLGVGAFTLLLQASCNSTVLMAAHGSIRGRVMSIYMTVWFLGIAIGGPVLGTIDQHFGPQSGMLLAGLLPGSATLLVATWLAFRLRTVRRSIHRWRDPAPQQCPASPGLPGDPWGGPGRLVSAPWAGLHVEDEIEPNPHDLHGSA